MVSKLKRKVVLKLVKLINGLVKGTVHHKSNQSHNLFILTFVRSTKETENLHTRVQTGVKK